MSPAHTKGEEITHVSDYREAAITRSRLKSLPTTLQLFFVSKGGTTCVGKPGSFKGLETNMWDKQLL